MAEFSPKFRCIVTRSHKGALISAQSLMDMMADNDPEHMTVALGEIEAAAARMESVARDLRDLIAITRNEQSI
ncbi:hypothetical protein OE699_02105 [Sedimentimonas flavescens]|uniref:Uncharacterized protein n=1 Tax=Sedimentimonas flavescens TaxID=2851012 RepID=A0ABT2ZVH1_9RHOB|nr:hypothetical protein [Sedimentimonas flavescens]MCV2877633.1 hypothetical protein [Sedimentimonas flavescens]